jgi:DNA-binding NtrC family response regulator
MQMKKSETKILLIEDQKGDLLITNEMLSGTGSARPILDRTNDMQLAENYMISGAFDAYLIDDNVNNRHIFELLKKMKSLGSLAPIIILSNEDNAEMDAKALVAGAADYLIKGQITGALLQRSIRYAIEQKINEQELLKTQKGLEAALEELKDHQQKLIEMENLKKIRELAGAVSHELSQPLQVIANTIGILKLKGADPQKTERIERMIQRISHLAHRLQNITNLKTKEYVDTQILDIESSGKNKP